MKPRNREVNIFNMSVLDLLTGALGAFCFLTLALFPSYYKMEQNPATSASSAAQEKPIKPSTGIKPVKGLEGPVPPFAFLDISAGFTDRPLVCANIELTETSNVAGGDLSIFPAGALANSAPDQYARFFLFAFRPGAYHLSIRASGVQQPCQIVLSLMNPNNNWNKTMPIQDAQHPIELDFNVLSTDINSDLWNNG